LAFGALFAQHAVSVWADAASLAAAGDDPAYAAAMALVAKHFAGPPQVSDLAVLAEFGPAADTGSRAA
jgi:quinol monooxygenase YgiN